MSEASWRTGIARAETRSRTNALGLAPVGFGGLVSILGSGSHWSPYPAFGAFLWLVGLLCVAGYGLGLRADARWSRLAMSAEEADMLPELGVRWAVLVLATIRQGRAETGQDRGALWVEDGRLTFSGHAMSFALTRDDLEEVRTFRDLNDVVEFRLRSETGAFETRLETLFGDRAYALPLRSVVRDWSRAKEAPGERVQFPPRALGPGSPTLARLGRKRLLRTAGMAVGAAILSAPLASGLHLYPAWIAVTAVAGFVGSRMGRAAQRDRAALEAR